MQLALGAWPKNKPARRKLTTLNQLPYYHDSREFADLPSLAEYRIENPPAAPQAQCPAADIPFTIITDGGNSFRTPTGLTITSLREAVRNTARCCKGLGQNCPIQSVNDQT